MSRVTNVIITGSGAEGSQEIAALNNACTWNENARLFQEIPPLWTAGSKHLECLVLVGAFNHLSLEALCESMRKVPWQFPESVQMFVCEEDDERFSEKDWV